MLLYQKKFLVLLSKSAEGVEFDYFAFGKKIAAFYNSVGIESTDQLKSSSMNLHLMPVKQEMDKFVNNVLCW